MIKTWNKIINNLLTQPRDLPTTPKTTKSPIWFYAYTDGTNIFVEKAKEQMPSSDITMTRRLTFIEFERVYPIYIKREQGVPVSKEAAYETHNQVYWYSIIKHCTN